ncbi:unnamed protein product [Candidula unifasciata]|uniref:G-protein coupled receptors family 1 profile domain-containing protein n=1 Tax=Candidula unifasciata TaxID=100452 RepID=A0A8S3ZPT6_9EUPU|nr:unnamed protein product [Candidula unifasciata]
MSANMSMLSPMINQTSAALLVSNELASTIMLIFERFLFPCIGVLGIAGNVTGIVALTREGFRNNSNVLLLSLSVSNVLFLIGINNILVHIYNSSDRAGFSFSEAINYVCYILLLIWSLPYTMGVFTGPLIPVLITGERILVIFGPFRAHVILTPRRTIAVLLCFYLLTVVLFVYHEILGLQLKTYVINSVTTSLIVSSDMRRNHIDIGLVDLMETVVNYLTGIIPLSLITVGCVVIGIKIICVTKRRRQLTSSKVKANTKHGITKTTKTLLKICLLYICCYGFGFSLIFIFDSELLKHESSLKLVMIQVQDLLMCTNCLGDFFIYCASNKRLWKSVTAWQR